MQVIVAVAIATVAVACQSGTAAANLKVGDCFNRTPAVDNNGDNIVNNTVTDCAGPHDAEVFLVFDVIAGHRSAFEKGAAIPRGSRRPFWWANPRVTLAPAGG